MAPSRLLRHGFTLVEMLVVITIIGLLVAMLLPAVQAARESGRNSRCSNNLKQLGLALQQYHYVHDSFPPGSIRRQTALHPCDTSTISWIARILPHLERNTIYKRIDWAIEPGNAGGNAKLMRIELPMLRCPSDEDVTPVAGYAPTNYVTCIGYTDHGDLSEEPNKQRWGVFGINSGTRYAHIRDGSSTTMLVSECIVDEPSIHFFDGDVPGYETCLGIENEPGPIYPTDPRGYSWFLARRNQGWCYTSVLTPNDRAFANTECELLPRQGTFGARSRHPGGVNVLLGDGAVDFYADNVGEFVWRSLGTRAGDELEEQ